MVNHTSPLENAQILQYRIKDIQLHSINKRQDLNMGKSWYRISILNVKPNELVVTHTSKTRNLTSDIQVNRDQTSMIRETEWASKIIPIQNLLREDAKIGSMSITAKAKRSRIFERSIHPFAATPILKITTEC